MRKRCEQTGKEAAKETARGSRESTGNNTNKGKQKATRSDSHGTILARPEQTHFVKSIRNRSIRRERVSWPGRAFYFRESETHEREREREERKERKRATRERYRTIKHCHGYSHNPVRRHIDEPTRTVMRYEWLDREARNV